MKRIEKLDYDSDTLGQLDDVTSKVNELIDIVNAQADKITKLETHRHKYWDDKTYILSGEPNQERERSEK